MTRMKSALHRLLKPVGGGPEGSNVGSNSSESAATGSSARKGDASRQELRPQFAADLAALLDNDLAGRSERVSKWSMGQHIEHMYRASLYVLERIQEAETQPVSGKPNILGRGFLLAGFIPRGVFTAIPEVRPKEGDMKTILDLKSKLKTYLENQETDLDKICAAEGCSRHPRMGWLRQDQWLFFLEVHHRHHLAIIKDLQRNLS